MSEEKCDHVIGLFNFGSYYEEVETVAVSSGIKKCDLDESFKFCPLCGVEIEGDLTSGG
jgi:hypothetical protein